MELRVRGVDEKLLRAIDKEASRMNLSRSKYVQIQLENITTPTGVSNELNKFYASIQDLTNATKHLTSNVDEVKNKVNDLIDVVVKL